MLQMHAANQLEGSQNQQIDRYQKSWTQAKKLQPSLRGRSCNTSVTRLGHRTFAHTFLKVVYTAQGAEEDQRDDGAMTSSTGPTRPWLNARNQREIGRDGASWCVVLRSPTFRNEEGKRRRSRRILHGVGASNNHNEMTVIINLSDITVTVLHVTYQCSLKVGMLNELQLIALRI